MKRQLPRMLSILVSVGGWVAVMANSAASSVEREVKDRSGDFSIHSAYMYGCYPDVNFGAPVHRVVWIFKGETVLEMECAEDTDCMNSAFTDCTAAFNQDETSGGDADNTGGDADGDADNGGVLEPSVTCTPEGGANQEAAEKCEGEVVVKAYTVDGTESTQSWEQSYDDGGYGCAQVRF